VFRSSKHIYAQLIDDAKGQTLAAASSLEKELKSTLKTGADKAAATAVGKLLAERAKKPASTRWCSTGAATAITAASRRWPTARAKAA
jgi:large subunit ribosomal protein L18